MQRVVRSARTSLANEMMSFSDPCFGVGKEGSSFVDIVSG